MGDSRPERTPTLVPKKGLEALWPLHGKKVLVRVDFNVPIKKGKITNDFRIRSALPTIRKIIEAGGKCIIMSHLGRPKGVPMPRDIESREHQRDIEVWVEEQGTEKTASFYVLSNEERVAVLSQKDILSPESFPKHWNGVPPLGNVPGFGKRAFFRTLSDDMKSRLLSTWREKTQTPLPFLQKEAEEATLKPVAKRLSELMAKPVAFAQDPINAQPEVDEMEPGDILVLENVRFYKEESSAKKLDRLKMARVLAEYGDYYVCDAFGTSHRYAASITELPEVMKHGVAGFLMKKEIDYFCLALTEPQRPMCAIVGGAKVTDKIKVLENLIEKVNVLVIGGGMAYQFLKAQGINIGKSFCEKGKTVRDQHGKVKDSLQEIALGIMNKCKERGVELLLPIDHITWTKFEATKTPHVTTDANIPDQYMALDIGPRTAKLYAEAVRKCNTAVWNGPMGVFEMDCYAQGTFAIVRALAEGKGMTIIGGGDSASAAEASGYAKDISHISTGGGASLELLEGKALPGIRSLDDAPETPESVQRRQLTMINNRADSHKQILSAMQRQLDLLVTITSQRRDYPARVTFVDELRRAFLNGVVVASVFIASRARL